LEIHHQSFVSFGLEAEEIEQKVRKMFHAVNTDKAAKLWYRRNVERKHTSALVQWGLKTLGRWKES